MGFEEVCVVFCKLPSSVLGVLTRHFRLFENLHVPRTFLIMPLPFAFDNGAGTLTHYSVKSTSTEYVHKVMLISSPVIFFSIPQSTKGLKDFNWICWRSL